MPNTLYYNFDTDKAFRVVGVFGNLMHVKEVRTHTLRAKMGAPITTLTFEQAFYFFEGFTEIKQASAIPYLKQLHKTLKTKQP